MPRLPTKTESSQQLVETAAHSHLYRTWSKSFTMIFGVVGLMLALSFYFHDDRVGWDVFRMINLGLGVYLIVFSLKVISIYSSVQEVMTGTAKLLPSHIKVMAGSYLLLVVAICTWQIYMLGRPPFVWGAPMTSVAFLMGIYGMGIMWRFQISKAAERGKWAEEERGSSND